MGESWGSRKDVSVIVDIADVDDDYADHDDDHNDADDYHHDSHDHDHDADNRKRFSHYGLLTLSTIASCLPSNLHPQMF